MTQYHDLHDASPDIAEVTISGKKRYALLVASAEDAIAGSDASAANQVITNTELGAVNETAASSDTASSGLNGRLQRIAQRLTTIIAGIPLLAGEAHIGTIGSHTMLAAPSASITRPADTTPYASGDLVANNTSAGSVTVGTFTVGRVAAGSGALFRCKLKKSTASLTNALFRLHLYYTTPTPSNGDNGAWLTNNSDNYLGSFDVTIDRAFTGGAVGFGIPTIGSAINFKLPSGTTITWLLEARAAYTPGSGEVFTPSLEGFQD